MNHFLEHLSARVDATAADLKTSLHEHVDSTVDSRLDTFKVELASLVRSAVVECIRTEGRYQHWRVETTYTPVSAHQHNPPNEVRLMPNHSTSFICGIPPPLLIEKTSNSSISQCIADVTFPSGQSVSIPLYNAQPTQHKSQHLDTNEQDNTSSQSAQTSNNQQISDEQFQTDNPLSLLPIASTSATVSDGHPSTNSVPSESPLTVSSPAHTVQLPDHIKQEHLDEQSDNGQQMDKEDLDTNAHNVTIKTEPMDCDFEVVKEEIKEEIKEDHEDDCDGWDQCFVKKEEVSDDDEVDNEGGLIRGGDNDEVDDERYEVTQPNVDCGQLLSNPSRDRKNDSNANESIEVCVANLSRDQHNTTTLNEPNEVTTVTQSAQTFSPQTSTGHGSSRTALDQQTTVPTRHNKRKQLTSKRSVKRSKITIEEDEGKDGDDIANEDTEEVKVKVIYLNCTQSNCNVKLDSMVHLHDHLSTVHKLSPFQCFATNCNARFDNKQKISAHIKLSHSRSTRFFCSVCHKESDSQHKTYLHWYHHHQTGQFQCNFVSDCAQVTVTRSKMRTHQLTKHQSNHLHCSHPGCTASFSSNSCLKQHQLTHLNTNQFHCNWPHCSKQCKLRANLVQHIRTQHFGLPKSMKAQKEKNIVDLRDPNEYVRVVVDE